MSEPSIEKGQIQPAFPADGMYAKGQCATGYVTFSLGGITGYFLAYQDDRFQWMWRLI